MRQGLIGIAAAVAFLAASGATAQVSYGVAKSPGVTFHAAPPSPTPPPSHPSRGHAGAGIPRREGTSPGRSGRQEGTSLRRSGRLGGDLFLARPHTYSPHVARHSRLRPHFYASPYALPIPYFLPGNYAVALDSTVSSSDGTYVPIDAGYLVLRIEPRSAMVYVDGFFMGSVEEGRAPGYELEAGPHRVEVRAEGFETITFDVRIRANDTITYTRDLERPAPATSPLEPVVIPRTTAAKTLYVIPRCYAGDRRPAASELPAHCSLADLRVIR